MNFLPILWIKDSKFYLSRFKKFLLIEENFSLIIFNSDLFSLKKDYYVL